MPEQRVTLPITGMTCANCAMNIERALNRGVPGVLSASVNFASERATVEFVESVSTLDDIISAVEKAGYGAIPPEEGASGECPEQGGPTPAERVQTRTLT